MVDIAPKLADEIQKKFNRAYSENKIINRFRTKLADGKATYSDAYAYANEVGNIRAKILKNNISSAVLPDGKMYFNIANKVIRESLEADFDTISYYCEKVQINLNKKAGIGLKAQTVELDDDRVMGFINRISSEQFFDDIAWILDEPVKTFDRKIVDDSVKKNAEFQHSAGVQATVSRIADSKCCDWCSNLAGTYVYPSVPSDVFMRHDNCKCSLNYDGKKLTAYTSRSGYSNTFRDQN